MIHSVKENRTDCCQAAQRAAGLKLATVNNFHSVQYLRMTFPVHIAESCKRPWNRARLEIKAAQHGTLTD